MREERAFYRQLLSRLLAERSDSEGLYIPRGESGMRRMIRHLIAMRSAAQEQTPLDEDIRRFENMEKETSE